HYMIEHARVEHIADRLAECGRNGNPSEAARKTDPSERAIVRPRCTYDIDRSKEYCRETTRERPHQRLAERIGLQRTESVQQSADEQQRAGHAIDRAHHRPLLLRSAIISAIRDIIPGRHPAASPQSMLPGR